MSLTYFHLFLTPPPKKQVKNTKKTCFYCKSNSDSMSQQWLLTQGAVIPDNTIIKCPCTCHLLQVDKRQEACGYKSEHYSSHLSDRCQGVLRSVVASSAVRHHRDAAAWGESAGPQDSSGPVRRHRREAEHHHEDVEKRGEEGGPSGASSYQYNQQKHHWEIHHLISDLQHGERTQDGMFVSRPAGWMQKSLFRHGMDGALLSVRGWLHVGGRSQIDERESADCEKDGYRSAALISVVLQKSIMSYLKNQISWNITWI